jgi:holo-[acyl-carrier protein] synthase
MIIGVGADITSIGRIEHSLTRHGERFIDRCFSPEEREKVESSSNGDIKARAAGYAKRWAAKEACAKALGLGIRDNIFLKDIGVTNDDMGRPSLVLSGGAKERLTQITPEGMTASVYISLSDEPPMALAFVIISAD